MSEAEEKNKALTRWWWEEVWVRDNLAAMDEFLLPTTWIIPSFLGYHLAPRA